MISYMMSQQMIVADANVLVSALRSSRGASNVVVRRMVAGVTPFAISRAVVLEYEDVLKRVDILGPRASVTSSEIDTLLDALCEKASLVSPQFRFRPFLDDPKDDIYVECALAAGATLILSRDRDFRHPAMAAFGLSAATPAEYLATVRNEGH